LDLSSHFSISDSVKEAMQRDLPLVALESTVITHGLPYPENFNLALDMETEVLEQGAVPVTVGVLDGVIHVGLDKRQIEWLATGHGAQKISVRDFASAITFGWSGGTTVAGTLMAAHRAGIRVFATGGIGGVHRQPAYDISADLIQLASTPLLVVCAGAKAILDLDATLEFLETHSVPVIGYETNEFPAFYTRSSGLKTSARVDTPEQAAALARAHWSIGINSAVVMAVPPPESVVISRDLVENAIQQALQEAEEQRLRGQAVTPFLLQRVSELTGGQSLRANLELLKNNARIAGQVARFLG
jgi:pseudouridine-5'-phosphate glycosidase